MVLGPGVQDLYSEEITLDLVSFQMDSLWASKPYMTGGLARTQILVPASFWSWIPTTPTCGFHQWGGCTTITWASRLVSTPSYRTQNQGRGAEWGPSRRTLSATAKGNNWSSPGTTKPAVCVHCIRCLEAGRISLSTSPPPRKSWTTGTPASPGCYAPWWRLSILGVWETRVSVWPVSWDV